MKLIIVLSALYSFISCVNSSDEQTIDLVSTLNEYSKIIESRDLDQLRSICTPNGFDSMMDWTDSLRKDKVVDEIATIFSQQSILFSQPNDSTFEVSTLQSERPLPGQSSGLIIIKLVQNRFKIDAYLGVVTVIN